MKLNSLKYAILTTAFALSLAACSGAKQEAAQTEAPKTEAAQTEAMQNSEETKSEEKTQVSITDSMGSVTVPFKPERVVALDNRTFQTLQEWGIKPVALPKDIISKENPYKTDESIPNIGNHKEPNLEIIAAKDPQLIIVGQRFAKRYEELKKLCPQAVVINLNPDVSKEASNPGENLVEGLKNSTLALGTIFDKEDEAKALIADFDKAIENVKKNYKPEETVMAVNVSGGEIGFIAPKFGRVYGPMYEIFSWTPALEVENASSDHKGDDISVEAIAQSNPSWIMVMDRDAAISKDDSNKPAKDVIEGAAALQNTTAIKEGNVIYAPADTYLNESIQTYIKLFNEMSEAFAK